jgi:hypothetical protein
MLSENRAIRYLTPQAGNEETRKRHKVIDGKN